MSPGVQLRHSRTATPPTRLTEARGWLRVLAHPVSVLALFTWIANDLLLKGSWPGIVTGKLGDFASLIVLVPAAAAVICLVIRARWLPAVPHLAVGTVAGLYMALNLSPALADLWSRALSSLVVPSHWWADPTDLLALPIIVVPVWVWRNTRDVRSPWAGEVAQLVLLVVALASSLATSCAADPSIAAVSAVGDEVWAVSADNWGIVDYAVSSDGGQSWDTAVPPATARRDLNKVARRFITSRNTDGLEPVRVCDGTTCWRASNESQLERSDDGGTAWTVVWEEPLDDQDLQAEAVGCGGGSPVGVSDVAVAHGDVVGAVGARGVLVGDGTTFNLEAVPPLDVYPATDERWRSLVRDSRFPPIVGIAIALAGLGLGIAALALVLFFVRRVIRSWRKSPP